jgi:LAS superfamily LD-carboxypeptidase LdcB
MIEEPKGRREIVLINKSEPQSKDKWDTVERTSKVLSIAAIPVVIAVGGWYIQRQLQNQTVSRDYVQLAVSILKEPDDKTKIKPELRAWAVDLLKDNSPTKLSDEVINQLKTGQTILPASAGTSNSSSTGCDLRINKLESLQSRVAILAKQLIESAKQQGIEVMVLDTFRSADEQDKLAEQGLSGVRGGRSSHNAGLAFDLVPVENCKPLWNDLEKYKKLGDIAKGLGLVWGGDYVNFKDYPHFEYKPERSVQPTQSSNANQ